MERARERRAQAQVRVRRLREAAREEVRENQYAGIQRENERLSRRLEDTLRSTSTVRRLQREQEDGQLARRRARARAIQRRLKSNEINVENRMLLERLSNVHSHYDYYKQHQRDVAKKALLCKNQALSKQIAPVPVNETDTQNHLKEEKSTKKVESKEATLRTHDRKKALELVARRKDSGIYFERKAELCVYKEGRKLDQGCPVVVSFYESTVEAGGPLRMSIYNQETSATQNILIGNHEILLALGATKSEQLVSPSRRVELCRALVDKLRSFPVNGTQQVILTSHMSFGKRESAQLADKRRIGLKLGKVPLEGATFMLPMPGGNISNIEQSDQVRLTVARHTAQANCMGDPFPRYGDTNQHQHKPGRVDSEIFLKSVEGQGGYPPFRKRGRRKYCVASSNPSHADRDLCGASTPSNQMHSNDASTRQESQSDDLSATVIVVVQLDCGFEAQITLYSITGATKVMLLLPDDDDDDDDSWMDCSHLISPWAHCQIAQEIASTNRKTKTIAHWVDTQLANAVM